MARREHESVTPTNCCDGSATRRERFAIAGINAQGYADLTDETDRADRAETRDGSSRNEQRGMGSTLGRPLSSEAVASDHLALAGVHGPSMERSVSSAQSAASA